jgi:hypothetical protein
MMNQDPLKRLEADLWRAADSLRANSDLKARQDGLRCSQPLLHVRLQFALETHLQCTNYLELQLNRADHH